MRSILALGRAGREHFTVEMGERVELKVPAHEREAGDLIEQVVDDFGGDLARDRRSTGNAGINMEKPHFRTRLACMSQRRTYAGNDETSSLLV